MPRKSQKKPKDAGEALARGVKALMSYVHDEDKKDEVKLARVRKKRALRKDQDDMEGLARDLEPFERPADVGAYVQEALDRWGVDLQRMARFRSVRSKCTRERANHIGWLMLERNLTFRDATELTGVHHKTAETWLTKARQFEELTEEEQGKYLAQLDETGQQNLEDHLYFNRVVAAARGLRSGRHVKKIVDALDIPNMVTGQKDAKTMLEFLSRLEPQEYGRKGGITHEVTGAGGGPVQLKLSAAAEKAEEGLEEELREMQARMKRLQPQIVDVEEVKDDE